MHYLTRTLHNIKAVVQLALSSSTRLRSASNDISLSNSLSTGPNFEVLPLRIYSMVRLGIKPDVNALCVVMMAFTILALLLTRILLKEKQ